MTRLDEEQPETYAAERSYLLSRHFEAAAVAERVDEVAAERTEDLATVAVETIDEFYPCLELIAYHGSLVPIAEAVDIGGIGVWEIFERDECSVHQRPQGNSSDRNWYRTHPAAITAHRKHLGTHRMQTFWLARHANRQDFADPDWAATADRPHDPGLSPDGVRQAKQLGRRVAALGADRIVSSPFLRAVETAHHAADAMDTAILLEPGLGEWFNDDWFETAPDTLDPATLAARFEHVEIQQPPESCRQPTYPESRHRALVRLGATGQCLADRHAGETLILVGHGITVQGVLHGLVGEDVPDPGCPLASLTKVAKRNGAWTIARRNDTSHLENGARAADRLA